MCSNLLVIWRIILDTIIDGISYVFSYLSYFGYLSFPSVLSLCFLEVKHLKRHFLTTVGFRKSCAKDNKFSWDFSRFRKRNHLSFLRWFFETANVVYPGGGHRGGRTATNFHFCVLLFEQTPQCPGRVEHGGTTTSFHFCFFFAFDGGTLNICDWWNNSSSNNNNNNNI